MFPNALSLITQLVLWLAAVVLDHLIRRKLDKLLAKHELEESAESEDGPTLNMMKGGE